MLFQQILVSDSHKTVKNIRFQNKVTALKMKFFIKDFFSKSVQIRSFLRIWSHLLEKFLMENFIFCAVSVLSSVLWDTMNCGTACACCSKVLFLHLALILCTLFSSISADLPYYVFVVLRLMLLGYFPFVLWFYSFWLSTKTCETCVRHCGTSNSKCYFALSEWVSEEKW